MYWPCVQELLLMARSKTKHLEISAIGLVSRTLGLVHGWLKGQTPGNKCNVLALCPGPWDLLMASSKAKHLELTANVLVLCPGPICSWPAQSQIPGNKCNALALCLCSGPWDLFMAGSKDKHLEISGM